MKRLSAICGVVLLVVLGLCSASWAANLRLTQANGAPFPTRTFILSLSQRRVVRPNQVTVNEQGANVTGVSVVPAASVGQSQFGTVLLIDTSNSMNGSAEQEAINAALTFVQTRNPHEPVGIVFFNQQPHVIVPLTTDTATLANALATVPTTHSGTHIFDAAATAERMLLHARLTEGSIVLLSDGADTGSHVSEQSFANSARSQGIRVFTVGAEDASFNGRTLSSLAAASNGLYTPLDPTKLVPFYRQLGLALSNEYLIRYQSTAPLGRPVHVTVTVAGIGSVSANYASPTLPSGVNLTPSHVTRRTFWTSALGELVIVLASGLLIGLGAFALLTKREGVRMRISGFVSAPLVESAAPRTLVQRALGDPTGRNARVAPWFQRLGDDLDIAGIQIAPSRLLAATVLLTVLLGFVLVTATSSGLAAPIALALPMFTVLLIRFLADRQRRLFDEQLPDNLTVIASALRAGHTFVGALGVMVEDAPDPSRRELRRALADEALGIPLPDALDTVAERMRSSDFRHVSLVATLQRDTGGNTAEVIDVVVDTIRDRLDLRRLVRSLTAQGRLSGMVLTTLPVLLLIAISLINPHYVHPLFHTTAGTMCLVVAVLMILTGGFLIKRIITIEV
jgi:tight adherence protein B